MCICVQKWLLENGGSISKQRFKFVLEAAEVARAGDRHGQWEYRCYVLWKLLEAQGDWACWGTEYFWK